MERLELTPEQLIAQDRADVFVVLLETSPMKPLTGLARRLDWRLAGALTRALRMGKNPEKFDCVYIPVQKPMDGADDRLLRFFIVPGGSRFSESLEQLKKNIRTAGFKRVAFSQSDLGPQLDLVKKFHFEKGVELCLTQ